MYHLNYDASSEQIDTAMTAASTSKSDEAGLAPIDEDDDDDDDGASEPSAPAPTRRQARSEARTRTTPSMRVVLEDEFMDFVKSLRPSMDSPFNFSSTSLLSELPSSPTKTVHTKALSLSPAISHSVANKPWRRGRPKEQRMFAASITGLDDNDTMEMGIDDNNDTVEGNNSETNLGLALGDIIEDFNQNKVDCVGEIIEDFNDSSTWIGIVDDSDRDCDPQVAVGDVGDTGISRRIMQRRTTKFIVASTAAVSGILLLAAIYVMQNSNYHDSKLLQRASASNSNSNFQVAYEAPEQQRLLDIAEQIVLACSESELNEDISDCQDLCRYHLCCFERDIEYSCEDDVEKDCAVYAGCEALIEEGNVTLDS